MSNSLSIPEVSLTEIIATTEPVASQGILTIGAQVTTGDTMVIGTTTYEFLTGVTAAAGKIGIGADEAACKLAIVAALNGTDGFNSWNSAVYPSSFVGDVLTLTAAVIGAAGDAVVTTSSFTSGSNLFDGVTLGTTTAGVDGSINSVFGSGRTSVYEPLVVRVMGHDDDTALEEDDPDLMALFVSKAQGHPWIKEKTSQKRIIFEAADGTTPSSADATYIVPFFDYSTYE